MPTVTDRITVTKALAEFQTRPLKDAARRLLDALGYRSDRSLAGSDSSPRSFIELFPASGFDQEKALISEWKTADLLFQLTDQELSRESSLFTDNSVKAGLLKSYVFIAIELKGGDYARGKFSAIVRQINRIFPMPVMVFFKHQGSLTIAVINRRMNKRDENRDVLGKVTLIREIDFAQPHRGHLDILASLALPNLVHPQKKPITDFDTLHAAWEQIFNVELLNERFYRELANWYFWALPQVEFPADLEPDDEKRRATGLIRLLTRLIFCWFLKEKSLIPEKLFHPTDLAKLLKGFDPESKSSSTYYQAILQNLFFATLNQRMGKDAKGQPYRVFAKDDGWQKNRATYDVNNLYRYEKLFAVPEDEALAQFADIPFLNGGLFECLDRTEESSPDNPVGESSGNRDTIVPATFKKRYLDGFSRNPKKRPTVPDRLFFDSGETADLSAAYGDTKRKKEPVTGLIHILNRYKFTIVENTPIDQEIALDPELLGKVFENLLASYNEETKTTARKQTGSFYTPRPIVDYMVDESLKAHLEQKVAQTILSGVSKASSSDISRKHRNLPHWTKDGSTYWITFRLADSLPQEKLTGWKAERDAWVRLHPEPWDDEQWKDYDERFGQRLESWLDAGSGECILRRPDVRAIVEKCLLHFDGQRYETIDWVIMPNHVHLLLRPQDGQSLSKILQGIKGVSAKECNAVLGRTGQTFWQEESYDHIVRSQAQLDHFIRYVADNPVKAKLKDGEFSVAQRSTDNLVRDSSEESQTIEDQTGLSGLRSRLDLLFAYTEREHAFTPAEVATLIAAIDALKVLDPACGSGAFPMGVLHKLVYILGKLDPDNERWKQTQLAKLDSAPMREQLEAAFADNPDDYGRKLYLIENCLYGVDIQPIAIQITKLRFFISLVCDQKTNRNKKDNHGIRPLPNLETKFVAADTLIGLPIPEPDLFVKALIEPIEKEIEAAYHSHFAIQRREQKLALQKKIKSLRQKLADTLVNELGAKKNSEITKKAQHVADWDPFDPQASADFFDPHWMFGRSVGGGFDIVVGNPPYLFISNLDRVVRENYANRFETAEYRFDLYGFFIERAIRDLMPVGGLLTYIIPHTLLSNDSFAKLRKFLLTECSILQVIDIGPSVFSGASNETMTFLVSKGNPQNNHQVWVRNTIATEFPEGDPEFRISQDKWLHNPKFSWPVRVSGVRYELIDMLSKGSTALGSLCTINQGLRTGDNFQYIRTTREGAKWKPVVGGKGIGLYEPILPKEYVLYDPTILDAPRKEEIFTSKEKILVQEIRNISLPRRIVATFDNSQTYALQSTNVINRRPDAPRIFSLKYILAVINSSVINYYFRQSFPGNNHIASNQLASIPIHNPSQAASEVCDRLVSLLMFAKRIGEALPASFLEDLIDACVMECYFREHMAERDLLFHDDVAQTIMSGSFPADPQTGLSALLSLNAPSHRIRNKLLRLTADSPDLLAVIKQEGRI